MRYRRMPIEVESPEEVGYGAIACNLAESSIADADLDDLGVDLTGLMLRYGDHRGLPALRELVAADWGRPLPADAVPLGPDDVLTTVGAAGALFITATALLEPGDEIVVVRPNYATNLETPRAIGADLRILDLQPEDGWATDPDALAALMTPRTRLVSITNPHNPTGALIHEGVLRRIVALVEAHPTARLLVDETYREMTYGAPLPPAATLSPRAIGVSGMSKTYGLPGIRTGWLTTRDRELMTTFLAAKEQIHITGSLVDEAIAARALERRGELLPAILDGIAAGLATVRAWLADEPRMAWVEPRGGVVASRGSGPTPGWIPTPSTGFSPGATPRPWGRATGSSGRARSSASASAGRPPRSSPRDWPGSRAPSTRWRAPRGEWAG